MTDHNERAIRDFGRDYPLWLSLSHFLSAPLVAELAAAAIDRLSGGGFSIDDLCEQYVTPGPAHFASWVIRLKGTEGRMAHFCQSLARVLAWQSDADLYVHEQDASPEELRQMRLASYALELGCRDLGTMGAWQGFAGETPKPLLPLADSILALSADDGDASWEARVDENLAGIAAPLRLIAYKHLGDLCIDCDRATHARLLYERSLAVDVSDLGNEWRELIASVHEMAIQSRAAMLLLVDGPLAALSLLNPLLSASSPASLHSLLGLNGPVDAMRAASMASEDWLNRKDVRPALLQAPQLAYSQNMDMAHSYWADRKFNDAHRRFWASLRRRRALGLAQDSQEAMVHYGRALMDELGVKIASRRDPGQFNTASSLIIMSGHKEAVGDESSKPEVVEAYVTAEAIGLALETAYRHRGMREQRILVLVKLFEAWILVLRPEKEELARKILAVLAQIARDEPWSFVGDRDLARSAFDALEKIAVKRPELRSLLSGPVTDAVLARVTAPILLRGKALETAEKFVDGLEPEDVERVVAAALHQLEATEPSDSNWLAARPAINIIASPSARRIWPQQNELAKRSARQLLVYGTKTQGFVGQLLAYFDELEPYAGDLIRGNEELTEAIVRLRARAHQHHNSAAINDIMSLLYVPKLASRAGLEDAVNGLIEMLATAAGKHPSISLGQAYHAIQVIAENFQDIASVWGEDASETLVPPLLKALQSFWAEATRKPLLFVQFSIPPQGTPDPVMIHNWAYATLRFGRVTGLVAEVDAMLDQASQNKELFGRIRLARASRLTEGEPADFDYSTIEREEGEEFYAALGSRLAHLHSDPSLDRDGIIERLLAHCMTLGPNLLDAAVMAQALERGIKLEASETVRQGYEMKMQRDASLRRAVSPLLRKLYERDKV